MEESEIGENVFSVRSSSYSSLQWGNLVISEGIYTFPTAGVLNDSCHSSNVKYLFYTVCYCYFEPCEIMGSGGYKNGKNAGIYPLYQLSYSTSQTSACDGRSENGAINRVYILYQIYIIISYIATDSIPLLHIPT